MEILRYAAFTSTPEGGNPAGVVLDARGVPAHELLAAAAGLGYSETAFLLPADDGSFGIRYFSPLAEVPFCGHATIATGVAHAERHGPGLLPLQTRSGPVTVRTTVSDAGSITATLTSVAPTTRPVDTADATALLAALRWSTEDLDAALPVRAAYAGAWHPVVAAATRERLGDLAYDYEALDALMAARSWTTVSLVWRESTYVFHARDPFPPGGVVEDPATGAAAAALGGYLRELALVPLPATVTIHQGHDLGRPSLLTVDVPSDPASGINVTGTAVAIEIEVET